jgi:hypothetical protein
MAKPDVDRSKLGRSNKRKGKTFESRVAHILTEFTGVNFRRVPCSGGFNKFGGVVVAEHVFSGDVLCDSPHFDFSVEAKNRQDITLTALLKNPGTAPFTKYWYQCVADAAVNNRRPMMFFKNAREDWVVITKHDAETLGVFNAPHLVFNVYQHPLVLSTIGRDASGKKLETKVADVVLPTPVMVHWPQFIKVVDPKGLFAGGP